MVSLASMYQTQNETDLLIVCAKSAPRNVLLLSVFVIKQNIDCIGDVGYPIFTLPHSIDGFYYIPCTHVPLVLFIYCCL